MMIIRPYFSLLLLIVMCCLSACGNLPDRQPYLKQINNDYQPILPRVLLVNSNQGVERYQIAQNVFAESVKEFAELDRVNLEHENAPTERLQDILNRTRYDAIYCIGAKALGSIDYLAPSVPVVYNAVMNWRRFQTKNNYYGVASELSPQVQLTWFKLLFPEMIRIGVLYSEENQSLIDEAQQTAKNLSISLITRKILTEKDVAQHAQAILKQVDALWLISDSKTMVSVSEVDGLFKLSDENNVPVFSYHPLFIDMGAVMSLVADLATSSRQAALITQKLVSQEQPKSRIIYPAGSRIILDTKVVERYRLKLKHDALDSVDEIR